MLCVAINPEMTPSECRLYHSKIYSCGYTKFEVRCRYKTSKDYASDHSYIALGGGKTRDRFNLPAQAVLEWTKLERVFDLSKSISRDFPMAFSIVIRKGTGEIYFDDFELVGIP